MLGVSHVQDCQLLEWSEQQQIHPQPSEIHELKTMMKRLMEQMSTMLHLLTTVISKMT